MKPEMILKADILDILFEDRNKDYGAYELRKQYGNRLLKATALMMVVVLLFIGFNYWGKSMQNNNYSLADFVITDSIKLIDPVQPREDPPKLEEPPKKIATIKNVVPRIVPDIEDTDPPPPIDELSKEDKAIGSTNQDGDPPTSIQSPPETKETGTGPAAPAAPKEEPAVLEKSEIMPEYPGGPEALKRFLLKNLRFDFEDQEPGTRIEIRCRFVVDKEGKVTGAEIVKSAGRSEYDREVTRVITKMPVWKPGIQNGRAVSVYFTLPVIVEVPEQ